MITDNETDPPTTEDISIRSPHIGIQVGKSIKT